jgi:hypothetical protein
MTGIIQEIRGKINSWLSDQSLYITMVLILVAAASFGLGRQSIITSTMAPSRNEATVVTATTKPEAAAATAAAASALPSTYYVASKNGQVYHLPHCSGAKNISEANKITFATKAEAEAAGYRPAANCKGI